MITSSSIVIAILYMTEKITVWEANTLSEQLPLKKIPEHWTEVISQIENIIGRSLK